MNGSNKKICIFNDIILKFDKVIWKEICKYLLTNDVLNLSFTCKNIRKKILKSCFSKIECHINIEKMITFISKYELGKQLTYLDLRYTKISDSGLKELANNCTLLTNLDLSDKPRNYFQQLKYSNSK